MVWVTPPILTVSVPAVIVAVEVVKAFVSLKEGYEQSENLRHEIQKFVMKQIVMTPRSTSWQESYYRETAVELSAISNIPRMARFPAGFHTWEKFSAYMKKAGLETEI